MHLNEYNADILSIKAVNAVILYVHHAVILSSMIYAFTFNAVILLTIN